MIHPFQGLLYCGPGAYTASSQSESPLQSLLSGNNGPRSEPQISGFLVTVSGPSLHVFSIPKAVHLDSWPSYGLPADRFSAQAGYQKSNEHESVEKSSPPPAKRPRLSPEESRASSTEIVTELPEKPCVFPNVLKIAASRDGKHIITISGDDKCVRVFSMSSEGSLVLLSERSMPKRPCALEVTPDSQTILCADKFGDVYALPLLGQTFENVGIVESKSDMAEGEQTARRGHRIPAATSLTVHTKRNRNALLQQQIVNRKEPQKKVVNFDKQLILGHVSLLTDILCATLTQDSGRKRNFIITSDRDEHIRVSRGMPHAFIIENYCLGHTAFVSKICLVPPMPELVLSGGGDDFLILWNWSTGEIRQYVDLKAPLTALEAAALELHDGDVRQKRASEHDGGQVAVNNIKFMPIDQGHSAIGESCGFFVVSLEGVPALFCFQILKNGQAKYWKTHATKGNVLDMTLMPFDENVMLYSMDTAHESGSTSVIVDITQQSLRSSIGAMDMSVDDGASHPYLESIKDGFVQVINLWAQGQPSVENAGNASVSQSLYGLENLRKRATDDLNEDDVPGDGVLKP